MPTLNFCGWKSDSQLTVRGQKIDKKEKLASTFKSHRSHIDRRRVLCVRIFDDFRFIP